MRGKYPHMLIKYFNEVLHPCIFDTDCNASSIHSPFPSFRMLKIYKEKQFSYPGPKVTIELSNIV